MSDKRITISIKGKVGYEDEITVAQAAQIIAFLNDDKGGGSLDPDPPAGHRGTQNGDESSRDQSSGKRIPSAREALDLSGAKTNPEKIAALGQYILQDGLESFTAEEVKTQFRRARETAPANFSRDLTSAIQAGWVAQGDGDEYYVTSKIDGIFDGDFTFPKGNSGARFKGSPKTSTKAKAKPEVFADVDEFPTHLNGLQAYSKMRSNRDRLLWALHLAKSHGIRGLSNKDITWLTDHLGVGVPSGHIAGVFRDAKAAGLMNRSTVDQTLRITEDGETHLKSAGAANA